MAKIINDENNPCFCCGSQRCYPELCEALQEYKKEINNMAKIIKKADIYLKPVSGNDNIRITIEISDTLDIEEILNNIQYAINKNLDPDRKYKLESIYFKEEEIKE